MLHELSDLRHSIMDGRTHDALLLVEELDGMSRKAIIRAIRSYLVRMLVHLIKYQAERRLTNSWAASIRGSVREIQHLNLQDNKRSYYLRSDEWQEHLEDVWGDALDEASLEAFSGRYDAKELSELIDSKRVLAIAIELLNAVYTIPRKEITAYIDERLKQNDALKNCH